MARPNSRRALRRHHARRVQRKRAFYANWYSYNGYYKFAFGKIIPNMEYLQKWYPNRWEDYVHSAKASIGGLRDMSVGQRCSCEMCSPGPYKDYRNSKVGKFDPDNEDNLSYRIDQARRIW